MIDDPINVSTGNSYVEEEDFRSGGWLVLRRFYNSQPSMAGAALGALWRHSFDRKLYFFGSPTSTIALLRPDGIEELFTKANGVWSAQTDNPNVLTEVDSSAGVVTGYQVFIASLRHTETYGANGVLLSVKDEAGQGITLTYGGAPNYLLASVTDPAGRQLRFAYDAGPNLTKVTLPDGGSLVYGHDAQTGNLTSVTYPDGKVKTYVYNESNLTGGTSIPYALTGIVDETGTRYESTSYIGSGTYAGYASASSRAGNVDATQITYNSNGSAAVQYPLGLSATLGITTIQGVNKVASVSTSCGASCDQPYSSRTYDTNGYPATVTDWNGSVTKTTYDSNGLLDVQVDASGSTNQRTTTTTWNTTLRVPLTRTVQDANSNTVSSTQWVYNTAGQTLARCEIDPTNSATSGYACSATGTVPAGVRRWTDTYCTAVDTVQCPLAGLLLTATGPRTDLTQTTTYSYYMSASAVNCGTPGAACHQPGDLYQVTDALGHVTTIASYDADGRITRQTDANGVNTDMTYTPRGWLASRSVGGATTSFTYTAYGAVQTVTDPDGVTTTYGYDTAHRLNKVTDALGNYVQYTLDAAGNKTGEQVYDASGTLHQQVTRTFNTLGQLTTVVDGLNATVFNASASGSYDANGNLVQSSDGLGIQRQQSYDALNRLVKTLDNYNGTDPATQNTTTAYQYDSLDRLTQVTDPSSLATTYSYDGLSNATGQVSPDTGTTNRTYDAAGNVLTRTDAKGTTATNTYDALNRLASTSYSDSTQNVAYYYDETNAVSGCSVSYPVGRLTRIVESNGVTTKYCYDLHGNVTQKTDIVATYTDTVWYTYTAADRLSTETSPENTVISYVRNGNGQISGVNVTPHGTTTAPTAVVSNATWLPFGPIASYTLGNGQVITRTYDANYRLTDLTSPTLNLHFARDAMGDIQALGNTPGANPATETYSYDPLYRLTNVSDGGTTL